MIKNILVLIGMAVSLAAQAVEPITEETLRKISAEGVTALEEGDFSVVEKYMHPKSKVVVDMDPAPGVGEKEISYKEYMGLTKMAFKNMKDAEVHVEIVSIDIDEEKNQGTIEEKTIATMNMMGVRMKDISISKTTYGYIDDQIKVLETINTAIATEVVK